MEKNSMEIKKRKRGERNGVKYNQKKRGQELEMFLFIIVLTVFAAVLGVVAKGGKTQTMEQFRTLSSGWGKNRDFPSGSNKSRRAKEAGAL